MRVFPIVVLTGCWVAPAAAPPPIAPAPRAIAIETVAPPARTEPEQATNRTIARYSNRDLVTTHLSRDEVISIDPRRVIPIDVEGRRIGGVDVATSELDYLGSCTRDFVRAQPAGARPLLLDVLGHYASNCAGGTLTLDAPLGCDGRGRKAHTDAALAGPLSPGGAGLMLRVMSCGSETSFDRISIESARESWTSPRVEVVRRGECDVGELPVTRALAAVLRRAVDDGDAMIKFAGTTNEIAVTLNVGEEIGSVLATVDAITPL